MALFGRRPPERVVRSLLPASENLHKTGCEQVQHTARLLDHLVRSAKERQRKIEAECLRGFYVDSKLYPCLLLHR